MRPRQLLRAISSRAHSSSATNGQALLPFGAIPGPKPLPFVGNIWRYLPLVGDYNIDKLYENAIFNRKTYGPIVREQITKRHVVLHLFDPQDIESFFRQDGAEPCRRSHRALLKFRHDNPERYNDGGIFPENGDRWARLRGLFNRYLMKKSQVELRSSILDDITKQAIIDIFTDKQHVIVDDLAKFLHSWTLKCALAVFLDYTLENMPERAVLDRILKCLDDMLFAIAGTEIKSERWTTQPGKCPFYQKLSKAETFTYEFVGQRIEHLLTTKSFNEISFVHDWLVVDQIDRKDIITFVLDCLLASVHTTAYTTTFFLENISRQLSEESLADLRQELNDHMPPMSETITHDIFDKMPLLKDCLKETLRLHPVSIGTGRLTQNNMTIRNYQIPEGVMVIAQNQLICREQSLYENSNQFCPSRWSSYRSQSRAERPSRFAWLPFGFGPRSCIGMRLVNLEIQILAARLLQNFGISFLSDIKTKTLLVHCLDGKIKVRLSPRLSNLQTS